MIVYLLFTKGSEHQSAVEAFGRELERRDVEIELVDADSPRGITLMLDYDVTQRPAVVLAGPDGTAIERWLGTLPLVADVSYLAHR